MESKTRSSRIVRASALLLIVGLSGCAAREERGPLLPIRLHERGVSSTLVLPGLVQKDSIATSAGNSVWRDYLQTRRDGALGVSRRDHSPLVSESVLKVDLERYGSSGRIVARDRAEQRSVIIRRR